MTISPELQRILADEMHGIQGLPALLFSRPSSSLEDLHLTKYEILNNVTVNKQISNIKLSLANISNDKIFGIFSITNIPQTFPVFGTSVLLK